jgi:predicted patatin/cPLA2 family phospholipase
VRVPAAAHPVSDVLRARAERGSIPGARDDPHRVALVLEGGGMRGVVSAAMAAALERLGLTASFDLVVGSSAGAINGAALIAGVAGGCAEAYYGPFASRSFVNPARIVLGRPVIDVNYVLEYESEDMDAGRHERALESPIALHCVAVDVATAAAVDLCDMRSKRELCEALLASSRMPLAGGAPVEAGGRRFVDGGLASPIPVDEAIAAGATHVLALQTRPHGVPRRSASRLGDVLIERHLRRLNPALVTLYRERIDSYETTVDDLARRSLDLDGGPPHVLGLRPTAQTPVVGQLERRAAVLAAAAAEAERLVEETPGLTPATTPDRRPTSRAARRA